MKNKHAQWIDGHRLSVISIWKEQEFFRIEEIVSPFVFEKRGESAIELFNPNALLTLIEMRILFDAPMTANNWLWEGNFAQRGYRGNDYYKGENTFSQHSLGNAFDFDVKGFSVGEARKKLQLWKRLGYLPHLIGIEQDVNWVHTDCRMTDRIDDDGLFWFSKAT